MRSGITMIKDSLREALPPSWVRFASLVRNRTYLEDGLLTSHMAAFLQDPRFMRSYAAGKDTGSWGDADLRWRVYIACWAGERAAGLGGDYVECGVNRGGISRAVMEYIDFSSHRDRNFYLVDTFRGFPQRYASVAATVNEHDYRDCHADVVKTFSSFQNARIVKGVVPEILGQVPAKAVCYLSIDMNCAEPEVAAMEFFWDKLVPGAMVVLDDYAYSRDYDRQREAMDSFAAQRETSVLSLPTGQGLIFKL